MRPARGDQASTADGRHHRFENTPPVHDGTLRLLFDDLLLLIEGYVLDLPSVRVGARQISRQSLAILRYYPSGGLDYLPILQTGNFDGMSINSRIGACVGHSQPRYRMRLTIFDKFREDDHLGGVPRGVDADRCAIRPLWSSSSAKWTWW